MDRAGAANLGAGVFVVVCDDVGGIEAVQVLLVVHQACTESTRTRSLAGLYHMWAVQARETLKQATRFQDKDTRQTRGSVSAHQ